MGCWNESCGITQLPVTHGDKVRMFILVNQESDVRHRVGGSCYSNEIWAPLGPPLQGKYDDYGCIEDIVPSVLNDELLDYLKEHWVPFEDKYEKIPPINEMKLEESLYFIERDYAKINIHNGPKVLSLMFVLEEVYQTMISYNPIVTDHKEKGWWYRPYQDMLGDMIKKWYTETLSTYQERLSYAKGKIDESRAFWFVSVADGPLWWDYRDVAGRRYKRILSDLIRDKQAAWDSEEVQAVVKPMKELMVFSHAMSDARKFWSPQTGKGSQDSELDIHKLLGKTVSQIIEAREKEYLEDGCEPRDAEGYTSYMREHNEKERLKDNGQED